MGVGCCLITLIAPITQSALITKAHTNSTRFNKKNNLWKFVADSHTRISTNSHELFIVSGGYSL